MPDLLEVEAALELGARHGLAQWGQMVLGEAQRGAPIEEGALRASGEMDVYATPWGLEVMIAFPLVYAATQHEHVEFVHPRGGHAKYLETPYKAHLPELPLAVTAGQRLALKALHGG